MSNTPEKKYRTRYGAMTASEAALYLLNRSADRLEFLETVFEIVHHDGEGFVMPGYMTQGLATILADIKHDVWTAHNYYFGDESAPGKTDDYAEVKA